MTIKKSLNYILKNLLAKKSEEKLIFTKKYWVYFFYGSLFIFTFLIYFSVSNKISSNYLSKEKNLKNLIYSKEFIGFSKFFVSKLKSPYSEIKYSIKNNDSIESILNRYNIIKEETKFIVNELNIKKLNNIYAGRELSIILKKLEDGRNKIISIRYPISNTVHIEIKKK